MPTLCGASRSPFPAPPEERTPPPSPPREEWAHAFDHPDGFAALSAVRDASGTLVDFLWLYANPAAEAMLHTSLARLLDRHVTALFPDVGPRGVLSRLSRVVETGEPLVVEQDFPLHAQERWFRVVALKRGDGLTVWLTDITQRKREELETGFLAEVSHLLTASLDVESALHELAVRAVPTLGEGCFLQVLDGRGQTLLLETVAREPSQEALLREVMRPEPTGPDAPGLAGLRLSQDAPQLLPALTPALLQALTRDAEHLRLLGALGPRSLMAVPLRARGRPLGVLVLLTFSERYYRPEDLRFLEDLADRVALSVDNVLLYREARQAVSQRDEFFTVAAHELRTPTTALKLNAQQMLRGARRGEAGPLPPPLLAKLESLDRNAGRLNALVNELLDVTRMHAGRLRLDLEPVDLTALVRDVAARFELPATQAHSPIQLHLEAPAATGTWDRVRLEQVVTNLLSNALKYGAGKPVHVRVEADDAHARLVVSDEGIGIAPESLPRLFGRFERAVSERHYGGLGLGLYITRQIVEALGGSITVRSAPGAGATFTVELPREATG